MAAASGQMDPSDSAAEAASFPSVGARLRSYAAAELARAIACLGWRGSRFHTGVHQARKSLRRTRATLALGGRALDPGAALIDRELRRVNTRLSKLRDTHALIDTLDHLLRKRSDDPAAAPVLRRVRRIAARSRAERARDTLAADPQLRDRRALLTVLHAALSALPWETLDVEAVQLSLDASAARVEQGGTQARASGSDDDWHRWRRRARRLSQQLRALGDSQPAAQIEEQAKRLAVLLGEAQDYSLLREHCGKRSGFSPADRAVLRELSERGMAHLRERIAKLLAQAPTTMDESAADRSERAAAPDVLR